AAGCSSVPPTTRSDIPPATQKAIDSLHIGMSVPEVVRVMKPVCLDCGTVYLGGTGQRDIYFQISTARQMFVSIGPVWQDGTYHHQGEIVRIRSPEPNTLWKRGRRH